MEREYNTAEYGLKYIEKDGKIYVTACEGNPLEVVVPEEIDGKPVAGIRKKAFLSKRRLKRLSLPPKLEEIGDFAFACCRKLELVRFPGTCPQLGRAVFQDCESLSAVEAADESWSEAAGELLAAAVCRMELPYLLAPRTVGSAEWLEKWDTGMEQLLHEDDAEGYQKQILCGEEDYESTDHEAFVRQKRKRKVRLSMLRLCRDEGLSETRRAELSAYLTSHTKGCESEESFEVLLEEYEAHPAYLQLFLDLGCVNRDNVESMLNSIGSQHPQLKARLLRYQEGTIRRTDFFGGLML